MPPDDARAPQQAPAPRAQRHVLSPSPLCASSARGRRCAPLRAAAASNCGCRLRRRSRPPWRGGDPPSQHAQASRSARPARVHACPRVAAPHTRACVPWKPPPARRSGSRSSPPAVPIDIRWRQPPRHQHTRKPSRAPVRRPAARSRAGKQVKCDLLVMLAPVRRPTRRRRPAREPAHGGWHAAAAAAQPTAEPRASLNHGPCDQSEAVRRKVPTRTRTRGAVT
mmetsp:Transcript_17016/g.59582  ORF Transcript_17016/g.59582 Transcript_17016/m.59582 type:complete len:224 (+) Transcript_17016:323-994(+)